MLTRVELSYVASLGGEILRSFIFLQKLVDEGRFADVAEAIEAATEASRLPAETAGYLRCLLPSMITQHLCRHRGATWAASFVVWAYRNPGWGEPLVSSTNGAQLTRAVADLEAAVLWSPRVAS